MTNQLLARFLYFGANLLKVGDDLTSNLKEKFVENACLRMLMELSLDLCLTQANHHCFEVSHL